MVKTGFVLEAFGVLECSEYQVEYRQIRIIALVYSRCVMVCMTFRALHDVSKPLRSPYVSMLKDAQEIRYK